MSATSLLGAGQGRCGYFSSTPYLNSCLWFNLRQLSVSLKYKTQHAGIEVSVSRLIQNGMVGTDNRLFDETARTRKVHFFQRNAFTVKEQ